LNTIWDVIVVGGGPAGASAARHAAGLGLETLVLEKVPFPRPKVCAGGVTEGARREMGLPLPRELIEREGRRLRPRWGGRHLDVVSARSFVYLVSRARFDQYLLWAARQAGAVVRAGGDGGEAGEAGETGEAGRVTRLSVEPGRVIVVTPGHRFAARVVIGADGVRSRVARTFRRELGRRETGLCLAADVPASPEQRRPIVEDGIEIRYGIPPRGYGWVFPKDGHVSVGVGAARYGFSRPGSELVRHLNGSSLPSPDGVAGGWNLAMLQNHLRAHLVPFGGIRRPVANGRVFLAGDAAGFADPFTGEGIRWACLSGRLAAEAAARGLKTGQLSRETEGYAEACRALIDRDLAWARWLTRLFARWPEAASSLFFRHPELFEGLLDVLRGELTYRRLVLSLPARLLAAGR